MELYANCVIKATLVLYVIFASRATILIHHIAYPVRLSVFTVINALILQSVKYVLQALQEQHAKNVVLDILERIAQPVILVTI